MSKKHLPIVALVGRTNVGKSTLFNRLTKRTESIVFDQSGITRDYLHEMLVYKGRSFDLVDTGGMPIGEVNDPFADSIKKVAEQSVQDASVVLFVCDGKNGLHTNDRVIARQLHKSGKPVILVLNKADNKNAFDEYMHEFYALGFAPDHSICTSAIHGTGITELLETIYPYLPKTTKKTEEKPAYKITLLGKPNVGKSSLMNVLLNKQRSIVSDIAGTTREAVAERMTFYGQDILLTDTAGVRRKRKVGDDELETMMVKSSLSAVRQTDIVVMMADPTEGRLSDQELKLLFYAFEQQKSVLLVFNKKDLLTDEKKALLNYELKPYEFFLKKIPTIYVSCLDKSNTGAVMREIEKIQKRLSQHFDNRELYEFVLDRLRKRPLFHKRQRLDVYRMKRLIGSKNLAFELTVNYPEWFEQSQCACIENLLRKKYDLRGCPIEFQFKKSRQKKS